MIALPYLGFALLAIIAFGFASFAVWRAKLKGGALLAAAIALFLLGIGGGTYWMLGRPGLAVRASQGLQTRDINGLVPYLIARVRKAPGDEQAWIYLGRAYLASGDADDGAKSLARAVTLARLMHKPDPGLLSAYGQVLVANADGAVAPEAEQAFTESLNLNPKDAASRYYVGLARAARGDKSGAISLWQNLLADVPPAAPLHQELIDRIAMLTSQTAGPAPDPHAMVAMLAAQLKADPHNEAGWERLIRAYTVSGEIDKAKDALATARKTFATQHDAQAALDAEAKDLKLN